MSSLLNRRSAYYAVALAVGVIVHQGVVVSIFGADFADLVRRNSEAYVMIWLPLYWDIFLSRSDPDGLGGSTVIGGRTAALAHAAWFGVLLLAVAVLQADWLGGEALPNAITTLGEGFLAVLAVSLYLGVTRGVLRAPVARTDGTPVSSLGARTLYYPAVAIVAVVAAQGWIGGRAGEWLEINSEAYAAMLLIPAYFDFIAPRARRVSRLIWYGGLAAVPVGVQSGALGLLVPDPVVAWTETTTEAFIAAFVISAYFDFWRRTGNHGSPGESSYRSRQ